MKRVVECVRSIRSPAIMLVAAVALFVIAEVVVRVVAPQDNVMTFVSHDQFATDDSLIGHVLIPNAYAVNKSPEYNVEYRTNAAGMRDRTLHEIPKPPGLTRILLLGDSFTFCVGTDYEHGWPVIFERRLLADGFAVGVVKTGVAGYDTRSELLYLKRLFPVYQPDIVVFVFLPNDIFTNKPIAEATTATGEKTGRDADHQVLRARRDKKTTLHTVTLAKRLLLPGDGLYKWLYKKTPRADYFTVPLSEKLEKQIDITRELFAGASTYCRESGAQLVVYSLPQLFQVIVRAGDSQPDNINPGLYDETFAPFAEEHGFVWIAALPVLADNYRAEGKDLYYRYDGHLNNNGNRVTADYLAGRFAALIGDRLTR